MAIADFDGDGDQDLAVSDQGPGLGEASVLLGAGNGTFGPPATLAINLPREITAGDFNGDGDPDLALGSFFPQSIAVFLGGPGGSFGPVDSIPTIGDEAESIALGDVDGDGELDIVSVASFAGGVSVLLGVGDGTFDFGGNFVNDRNGAAIAVGDFDGDTDLDLAFTRQDVVSVLLNSRLLHPPHHPHHPPHPHR